MKEKCIVMLSGGLDSRLTVKIMQSKGWDVIAVHFNLPFGSGCCDEKCSFNFSQMQGVKLKIFDCSKGKLLKKYLKIIKEAKHGRGAGVNPCIDCRIFMLQEAKKFADKKNIKIIATGEVIGQRPMSQQKKQMAIIEKATKLGKRIKRPLMEYYHIQGRRRTKQMELAKKFKIDYPSPGGGCLLCEKELKKRLTYLLDKGLDEKEIKLISVGRHFLINNCWIIIGRDEKENKILKEIQTGKLIEPKEPGPSALIIDGTKEIETISKKLIDAYSKNGSL